MTDEEYLNSIEEKIGNRIEKFTKIIEDGKAAIQKQKQEIWEDSSEMDTEELLENKEDMEQAVYLLEFYQKNLNLLKKLKENPYFGKISFRFDDTRMCLPVYVGLAGFQEKKSNQPLIFDWRAPISSMYYEYELGHAKYIAPEGEITGEILEKKQFKIRDGKLQYVLDTDLKIDDEVLCQELSGHAGSHMRQVAATIQKKQNEIIRNHTAHTLIIHGCAGSGKTVIALHRVAWLLYNYKKQLNHSNVMILSPNGLFSDYISEVLPELGEDNVIEKEWDDLMADLLLLSDEYEYKNDQVRYLMSCTSPLDNRLQRIQYKSSIEYFHRLNEFLRNYPRSEHAENETVNVYLTFLEQLKQEKPEMCEYHNEAGEICYEDVLAVFYLQVTLYGGGSFLKIKHLLVDEMQDYNIFQYSILKKLFQCPKTILGDGNQALLQYQENIMEILKEIFPQSVRLTMKQSYRSTMEITEFCNKIIGEDQIKPFKRHGKEPLVFPCSKDMKEQEQRVLQIVEQLDHEMSVAILCEDADETAQVYDYLQGKIQAAFIQETTTVYHEGVMVMPRFMSKGLEFDAVIVVEARPWKLGEDGVPCCQLKVQENLLASRDRQAFYIACTRALHELYVVPREEK